MLGKIWGQEEKGATEDEMVGWHHWLNEHEFKQTSGDSERQGSLACCSSWGLKQLDVTLWMNNIDNSASQVVLVVKNLPASAGDARDMGSIPGSERSPEGGNGKPFSFPRGGNGNPLQYPRLKSSMDRGAGKAIVHRVAKSRTWLSIHTNGTFVTVKGPMLVYYYQLNSTLYLNSANFFPLRSFFVFGSTLHLVAMPFNFLCNTFSDFSCFWEPKQFWGRLVRYFVHCLQFGFIWHSPHA